MEIKYIIWIVSDSLLFFIGVPVNSLLLISFGRRTVAKTDSVVIVLALAADSLVCCSLPGLLHSIQISTLTVPFNINQTDYSVSICNAHGYPLICNLKTISYGFELFACQLYGLAAIVCFSEIRSRRMSSSSNDFLKSSSLWISLVILVCLFVCIGLLVAYVYTRIHNNLSSIKYVIKVILFVTGMGTLFITLLFHSLTIWWIRSEQKLSKDFAKDLQRKVNAQRSANHSMCVSTDTTPSQELFERNAVYNNKNRASMKLHNKTLLLVAKRMIVTLSICTVLLLSGFCFIYRYKLGNNKLVYVLYLIFQDMYRFHHISNPFICFTSTKFRTEYRKLKTELAILNQKRKRIKFICTINLRPVNQKVLPQMSKEIKSVCKNPEDRCSIDMVLDAPVVQSLHNPRLQSRWKEQAETAAVIEESIASRDEIHGISKKDCDRVPDCSRFHIAADIHAADV